MLFEVKSRKNLDEIDTALKDAAARQKFGVIAVIDLKQKMSEKGVEFTNDCRIYEVCNPQQAKRVLEANGSVSTALPCRISVFGQPGQYTLATLKPTELMHVFATPGMDDVASDVEAAIVSIMQGAA